MLASPKSTPSDSNSSIPPLISRSQFPDIDEVLSGINPSAGDQQRTADTSNLRAAGNSNFLLNIHSTYQKKEPKTNSGSEPPDKWLIDNQYQQPTGSTESFVAGNGSTKLEKQKRRARDPLSPEEARLQKRKLSNKESARRSRKKVKEGLASIPVLEEKNKAEKAKNAELKAKNAALESENERLRNLLKPLLPQQTRVTTRSSLRSNPADADAGGGGVALSGMRAIPPQTQNEKIKNLWNRLIDLTAQHHKSQSESNSMLVEIMNLQHQILFTQTQPQQPGN